MSPQFFVKLPQQPDKTVAIKETHHQDYENAHQYGNHPDEGYMCFLLLVLFRRILNRGVDDHLSKTGRCIGVTSFTGGEGLPFIFEREAVVCAMAVGAERRFFIPQVDGGLAVIIIQIGGRLGRVARAASDDHLPSDFHAGQVPLYVMA